jgi:hypothetical protein
MMYLMLKKRVNTVLIFEIRRFVGLGKFFDLCSMGWCLSFGILQFNKKFNILSVPSYAPFSHLDKVDTQRSNELVFTEY